MFVHGTARAFYPMPTWWAYLRASRSTQTTIPTSKACACFVIMSSGISIRLSNLKLSQAGKANKSPLIYIYIIHLYVYICTYNASSFTDWLLCGSLIHRTVSSIGAWATAQANLSLTVYVNCFSYLISLVYGGHSYACWRFDGHFKASHSSYACSPAPPHSYSPSACQNWPSS